MEKIVSTLFLMLCVILCSILKKVITVCPPENRGLKQELTLFL
jgi:hypothetical protein